jgi:hypothetical protein
MHNFSPGINPSLNIGEIVDSVASTIAQASDANITVSRLSDKRNRSPREHHRRIPNRGNPKSDPSGRDRHPVIGKRMSLAPADS